MEITAQRRIGRRILFHIEALHIPRFTGSPGEESARRYIRQTFLNDGYGVIERPFTASLFPGTFLPRLSIAAVCAMILTAFLSNGWSPVAAVELCILALLTILLVSRWSPWLERMYRWKVFGTLESRNIVALHPHQQNRLNVVFTAHYDSKSQTFSGAARFLLYILLAALVLINAILITLNAFFSWDNAVLLAAIVPMTVVGVLLQVNGTKNRSPGAYDNASGVGILLELAHSFGGEIPGVNLVFIATGAEEAGLCGAVALMQDERMQQYLPPSRTIMINIDSVGNGLPLTVIDRYGIPPVRTGGLVAQLCLRIAERFGIPARSRWIPTGAAVDHIPFSAHGYQTVTLSTAGWSRAFRAMHTVEDVPDNLSVDALEQCYAVVRELVDSIPSAQYIASLN